VHSSGSASGMETASRSLESAVLMAQLSNKTPMRFASPQAADVTRATFPVHRMVPFEFGTRMET
jgi:hypothetical protein